MSIGARPFNFSKIELYFIALFVLSAVLWRILGHEGILPTLPYNLESVFSASDFSSEQLLYRSIDGYAANGDSATGGFMIAIEPTVHIAAVRSIDGPGIQRDVYPYISHFGLQYHLMKALSLGRAELVLFVYTVGCMFALIAMATVAALIAAWARMTFSATHALAVLSVFLFSPMMWERAFSGYWLIFLSFLPFLVSLLFYRQGMRGGSFAKLCGAIACLVCLKALTGYEYLTTIALSAAVPVVFYEVRAAEGRLSDAWRVILINGTWIGSACFAGFVLAAALHVWQAAELFGTWNKGLQAVFVPFGYSTFGDDTGIRSNANVDAVGLTIAWVKTLGIRNGIINAAVCGALFLGIWRAIYFVRWQRRTPVPLGASNIALSWTILAAVAASGSWQIFALKHTLVHSHINWITMYIPFIPLGAVLATDLLVRTGREALTINAEK